MTRLVIYLNKHLKLSFTQKTIPQIPVEIMHGESTPEGIKRICICVFESN